MATKSKQSSDPFPSIVNRALREFVRNLRDAQAALEDAIGKRDNAREITKAYKREPNHPEYLKAALSRCQALDQIDFQRRRIRHLNSEIKRVVTQPDEPTLFDGTDPTFDYTEPGDGESSSKRKPKARDDHDDDDDTEPLQAGGVPFVDDRTGDVG